MNIEDLQNLLGGKKILLAILGWNNFAAKVSPDFREKYPLGANYFDERNEALFHMLTRLNEDAKVTSAYVVETYPKFIRRTNLDGYRSLRDLPEIDKIYSLESFDDNYDLNKHLNEKSVFYIKPHGDLTKFPPAMCDIIGHDVIIITGSLLQFNVRDTLIAVRKLGKTAIFIEDTSFSLIPNLEFFENNSEDELLKRSITDTRAIRRILEKIGVHITYSDNLLRARGISVRPRLEPAVLFVESIRKLTPDSQ
jgi:hypothetical protein